MSEPIAHDESEPSLAIPRLREIVRRLRAPGGCPWDIEQSHESLIPNLLEEAYEAADAIRSGDRRHMCEELGDLMLQSVMHAQIASEAGDFDLDDVAAGIADKLVRRHPHVFGDSAAADTEAVLVQWDEIKRSEKVEMAAAGAGGESKSPSALDGVPVGMPALMRAKELQGKAAKVGFDWARPEEVLPKVREEIDEVASAMLGNGNEPGTIAIEIGDLLFSVVNLARKLKIDPESALADSNAKFARRFRGVEGHIAAAGGELESASLAEMDAAWEAVKASERSTSPRAPTTP